MPDSGRERGVTSGMTDLDDAVRTHCELFNASVASGDWNPFLATFTDDARMVLVSTPLPPIVGREAMAAAYAKRPPTDTMTIDRVEAVDDDTARSHFTWGRGGTGTMVVRWRDDQVVEVEIS